MFEDWKYEDINGLKVRREDCPYTPEEQHELYRQTDKVVAFTHRRPRPAGSPDAANSPPPEQP